MGQGNENFGFGGGEVAGGREAVPSFGVGGNGGITG